MMNLKNQKGATLIGMMIGVLLSLLAVAAMFSLYQVMAQISSEVQGEMNRDAQMISSLQVIGMEIQQAGFGVPAFEAQNDNLWVSQNGKKMVWRYKRQLTDTSFTCTGLQVLSESTNNIERGLYLYQKNNCATANSEDIFSETVWQKIAGDRAFFENSKGEVGGLSLAQAAILKGPQEQCYPYAAQDVSNATASPTGAAYSHPTISITIEGRVMVKSCLINLKV